MKAKPPKAAQRTDPPYKVGYGRPPIETRFKKGQSGNPSGRPKSDRASMASFERILARTVILEVDGVRRKMTLREAIEHKIVEQGSKLPPLQMLKLLTQLDTITEKEKAQADYMEDERIEQFVHQYTNLSSIFEGLQALGLAKEEDGVMKLDAEMLYAMLGPSCRWPVHAAVINLRHSYLLKETIIEDDAD